MSEGLGTLIQKLARVAGELGNIDKDAKHQQGFMYHSIDAVKTALNPLLAREGIVIIPSAHFSHTEAPIHEKDVPRHHYVYEFNIYDTTGAHLKAEWAQSVPVMMGSYPDDKADGKNHSYALKYWLIHTFMISTGDEPDLDKNYQDTGAKTERQNNPKPASQANKSKNSQTSNNQQAPANQELSAWANNVYRWAETKLELKQADVHKLLGFGLGNVNTEDDSHDAIARILVKWAGSKEKALLKINDPAILKEGVAASVAEWVKKI